MSDHAELKRAAETVKQTYAALCEHGGDELAEAWNSAELAYDDAANPDVILTLIAENELLAESASSERDRVTSIIGQYARIEDERNQLKAELSGLRTGFEAQNQVNAELKAENEALVAAAQALRDEWRKDQTDNEVLRNSLAECASSLHGEMLQKFGGQLPEDMHPVTRREYDRDMAEVAGYRAAMGKGGQP